MPDSSRGNYHSVHNKSHNKHLENDFIIHSASIKVSYDPSETHTHGTGGVIVMKENYIMHMIECLFDGGLCEDAHLLERRLIGRCVNAALQPWMEVL